MMSSASKRRCLRVNFPVCEGSQNGIVEEGNDKNQAPNLKYFAVRHDASQVEMRVQYEGKDIGRFTHRINPTEKSPWVKANFLVELITHYGGRKPIKGGREHQDMNLRSLHEVFQALPSKFPETLVGFLNGYTPAKKDDPVPKQYSNFIIQTWKDNKDEMLRLYETRVQPTTSAHVVPDSCTDEMEIGEREAEFSKQTISQQSEIVEIDDLTQRMKNLDLENKKFRKIIADLQAQPSNTTLINRIMELEKIIADLQAQPSNTTLINRIMELEKIIADLQAQPSNTTLINRIMELEKIIADLQAQHSDTRFNNHIMELEKVIVSLQAQLHERNKTCTNHDRTSKDIQVPWLEHIDKCLTEQPRKFTREDANRVPSEVPDVEEENFQNLPLDVAYFDETWG